MFKIIKSGHRGVLKGRATPALVAVLPRLEGQRRFGKEGLTFEATEHNISLLKSIGAKVEGEGSEEFEVYAMKGQPLKRATRKTQPFPHQKQALAHFDGKSVMALFMEQGTGKTKTVLDWSDDLYASGQITGVIVVSRNGVHRQWANSEIPRHMSSPGVVMAWDGNGTQPITGTGLQVITINWDAIKFKGGFEWVMEFCERHKGRLLIIADEAQDMKNHRSQRHKAMMKFKPYSSHRAVTTGTPIAKDLCDEWAILLWLDENIIGVKYITTFRAEYCIMGGFQNRSVVGHREIERFRALTAPFVFRVKKTDIGLLPKQYDQWPFKMAKLQREMIDDLRNDAKLELSNGAIISRAEKAARLNKVQQISNGFIIDDDGTTHRLMPIDENPRVLNFMEWFGGSDSKAIAWCKFREDIAILSEAMGRVSFVTYMGGMKDADKQKAIDSFLDPDGAKLFIATDAASTGLNLQGGCNRAGYYSEGFNAINRWQKEDRIDRIGTVGFTTHTDFIAMGSADRSIMNNRMSKKGISDMAIENLGGDSEGSIFDDFFSGDDPFS